MNNTNDKFYFSFTNDGFKKTLSLVSEILEELIVGNRIDEFGYRLANVINSIMGELQDHKFQKLLDGCTYSRTNSGFQLDSRIEEIEKNEEKVEVIYALFFCYFSELYFKGKIRKTFEMGNFFDFGQENFDKFNSLPRKFISHALYSMPTEILRNIFDSDEVKSLIDISAKTSAQVNIITDWNNSYEEKKLKVDALKESLNHYESAFNFVGLYEGFDSLQKKKMLEKNKLEENYRNIGAVIIGLILVEFIFLNVLPHTPTILSVISLVIPSLTMLLVLLYFLRITLINLNSVRSQLLQIDLRMTLCRFIQKYSESSKDLRENNEKALERFESLIFSSIVSTDEKIPTTFDGTDQLANLIKALRGN